MWCCGRSSVYKDRENDEKHERDIDRKDNNDTSISGRRHAATEDRHRAEGSSNIENRQYRKERLHRRMQSDLCEIRPELKAAIGEKRLALLRRQFSWHDSDNNGYIEADELPDFLRAAGFNPVQPSLELWCSHIDSNSEGCLTFPGYVEFWHQNNAELEQDEALIAMAFKFFDKNADGRVDKAEFFESLQKIGDPLTSDEIESFFKHVHEEQGCSTVESEQSITFDELLNFFRQDRINTRLLSEELDENDSPRMSSPGSPDLGKIKQFAQLNGNRTSKFVKQMYMKKMTAAIQSTKTAIETTTKAMGKDVEKPIGLRSSQTGKWAPPVKLDSLSKRSFSS